MYRFGHIHFACKTDPSSKVNRMGQPLFETFDPREATGIEIVEMDEEELKPNQLKLLKPIKAG